MQRRSLNRRPRKYTEDAFEHHPELQSLSRSASPDNDSVRDGDDAFEAAEPDPSEDEVSEAEASEVSAAVASDVESSGDDEPVKRTPTKAVKARARPRPVRGDDDTLHTRRLREIARHASKEERWTRMFGPDPKHAAPSLAAMHRWKGLPVLPSKLESATGQGGFHKAQPLHAGTRRQLYHADWLWYYRHGGRELLKQKQVSRKMDAVEARTYLPAGEEPCDFLIGPLQSPNLHALPAFESRALSNAWYSGGFTPSERSGFILNTGARVHSLQWLPRNDAADQYLAVTVLPERPADHPPFQAPVAPAFTPRPAFDTAIQIWRLPIGDETALQARLSTTLCTSWGDVRSVSFCPMDCDLEERAPLLLAGIWGDGKLRIMEIPDSTLTEEHQSILIQRAAIEIVPPDTVFTDLSWMSPRLIAAVTANGHIAIIDIDQSLQAQNSNPQPLKYAPISETYIHGVESCWPSFPHLLFTISMDGHLRLTDASQPSMSSPEANAQAARVRAFTFSLKWNDFGQSALLTDDNFNLRCYAIRRMYSQQTAGRTNSTAIAMATSPCHPFILLGTSGGDVVSTNSLIRLQDVKKPLYGQTWFAHEWRRPMVSDQDRIQPAGQRVARNGLSRFIEGYKAERMMNQEGDGGSRTQVPQTVYEKKTAVTAVAWNPNMVAAGWAAAGLADGLVRIEDIALPAYPRD